jgi:hypothetical protein
MSFLDTEEADADMLSSATDRYPAIPIFSRRYLLASRDVVTELGLKQPKRRLPGLPGCKPHLCDHCETRWYSF